MAAKLWIRDMSYAIADLDDDRIGPSASKPCQVGFSHYRSLRGDDRGYVGNYIGLPA
jgi:hypothetical protein